MNASDRIDAMLAQDPLRTATQISSRLLQLEVYPLIVTYSWSEPDQRVYIENVIELGPLDP